MRARIYVMYGQFGWITSIGMANLANRIAGLNPDCPVTTHSWKYPSEINIDITKLGLKVPIILVGYSLGANSVTIAASAIKRDIALGICYDPSVLGIIRQPTPNIKRLLLYHNTSNEPWGHLVFYGPQVEQTNLSTWHLAVCFNEGLHQRTLAAIKQVIGS